MRDYTREFHIANLEYFQREVQRRRIDILHPQANLYSQLDKHYATRSDDAVIVYTAVFLIGSRLPTPDRSRSLVVHRLVLELGELYV